jgi:hypothetical protein
MQSPHSWGLIASNQNPGEIAPNRLYQTRRRVYPETMLERVHCSRRGVEVEYRGSSVEGVRLSSASWDLTSRPGPGTRRQPMISISFNLIFNRVVKILRLPQLVRQHLARSVNDRSGAACLLQQHMHIRRIMDPC